MTNEATKNEASTVLADPVDVLVICKHCGKPPRIETVFATGAYYKCRACDFPVAQFPIFAGEITQRKQWNKLNT